MKPPTNKRMRLLNFNYDWRNQFFVTICTENRNHLFGHVENGKMQLSSYGEIAHKSWQEIPNHFPEILIDEFIIMPDHIHGILHFGSNPNHIPDVDRHICQKEVLPQHQKLSVIVGSFKSATSRKIRSINPKISDIWQKSFHDRLIRTDNQLAIIRQYIKNNPQNWIKKN